MRERPEIDALVDLAREAVQPPSPAALEQGLRRLSARVSRERARRRPWASWSRISWSLLGLAMTGAAALVLFLVKPRPVPPPYQITNGSVLDGGYLRESGGGGLKLTFAGGTTCALATGTRGRLRAADTTGARIAIEHGTATFDVVPQAGKKWLVDVGPFLVTVKGTVFTVSWDVASERFELRLMRGRVAVSGPTSTSGSDITLEAGHKLVVDLARAETTISELEGEASAAPRQAGVARGTPSAPTAPSTDAPAPALGPKPESHRRGTEAHRWPEALATGHLDEILHEATALGVKSALEGSSADDLFALADAARYRRKLPLAREALLAARRRFPSSPRAQDAAYLLGRVEEATSPASAKALRWYEEYLRLAPRGSFAAEALGRRMILTNALEGRAPAAPLAATYLRLFPSGAYAGAARGLVE